MPVSFSDLEYAAEKKQARRDRFLTQLEALTPWVALAAVIAPFYPNGRGAGRPPISLARMLRMYVAQQCFGLSDENIEGALYDSQAIRRFVGVDVARGGAGCHYAAEVPRPAGGSRPDRRDLSDHHAHLALQGLLLRQGTRIHATLIAPRRRRLGTATGRATRPCIRRRRATNGTLA